LQKEYEKLVQLYRSVGTGINENEIILDVLVFFIHLLWYVGLEVIIGRVENLQSKGTIIDTTG
jgi:hypothetical protein